MIVRSAFTLYYVSAIGTWLSVNYFGYITAHLPTILQVFIIPT